VVADEVRSLAIRAAQAAKSTASLIEDTTKKVKEGSVLVARSNEAFSRVGRKLHQGGGTGRRDCGRLERTAQGSSRSTRRLRMNRTIQQSAASAEESASAAQQMDAEAAQMKAIRQ